MNRYITFALLLAGCVSPGGVPCGEYVCATGDVCTTGGCAAPADVTACDGLEEGKACLSARGGTGVCTLGACRATTCGNAIVELGEACDGEQGIDATAGEVCSADCRRIEVCGNGIVDGSEQCDDANGNAADGCDACVATAWSVTPLVGATVQATQVDIGNYSVTTDTRGNAYVCDTFSHQIWRIDASGAVTLVAGTGQIGFSGDGGPAPYAQLSYPEATAADDLGNVFIFDEDNRRIRKVDARGIITTIAGTGVLGSGGDGGPATSASLGIAHNLAVDGFGSLYFPDRYAGTVRKIDPNGIITTFAGTTPGFGGDGGPATSAMLDTPEGVAVGPDGSLYIADSGNHRVRKISTAGVITTVAGTGIAGFSGDNAAATLAQLNTPTAVAVDAQGRVLIADFNNFRVRRVGLDGIITTVVGSVDGSDGDGGPATSALIGPPRSVAVASDGSILIAHSSVLRRIDPNGTINRFAGLGTDPVLVDGQLPLSAPISQISMLRFDAAGTPYWSDGTNHVRTIVNGVLKTFAGTGSSVFSGDGGPALLAGFSVTGIAIDSAGQVLIADSGSHRIRRINTSGIITTIAGTGSPGFSGDGGQATSAQLNIPRGLATHGSDIYFSDGGNNRVRKIDAAGVITTVAGSGLAGFTGDNGSALTAKLSGPTQIAVDATGRVYIADEGNNRVRRVDVDGTIRTVVGTGVEPVNCSVGAGTSTPLSFVGDLIVDATGRLLIADISTGCVLALNGTTTSLVIGAGTISGGDGGPVSNVGRVYADSLAISPAGLLYFAGINGIHRIEADGRLMPVAGPFDAPGTGILSRASLPNAVALAADSTVTLVADGRTGTVEALRAGASRLETWIGRFPQADDTLDLARFRSSSFGEITGVALDAAAGRIYISTQSDNTLWVVSMTDPLDPFRWTISALNGDSTAGHQDGPLATARFRSPAGLYLDAPIHVLFVADTGNHVVRRIDLGAMTVTTEAGKPATLGYFGDGGPATAALLFQPTAVTRCPNGDLFIADTGNQRIRRVAFSTHAISTVLGDGTAVSSGYGVPSAAFPIDRPSGVACDSYGNVYATSSTSVRLLLANADHEVDGIGEVQTIYGRAPVVAFPETVTRCLSGIALADDTTVRIADACAGLLIELRRAPATP